MLTKYYMVISQLDQTCTSESACWACSAC